MDEISMRENAYDIRKFTLSKTSYEWKAWQLPCWKLPQVPSGVPKLANLIDEIFWPGEHHKCTLGLRGLLTLPDACIFQFIRVGCHSKISEQTLSISLWTREIPFGSPPHSSKTTNKFPVGYNHERGMWYLKSLGYDELSQRFHFSSRKS